MSEKVILLDDISLPNITLDARVVALRWDVLPWGLVIDLDVPLSEDSKTKMRRAWLYFEGLSSLTWPLVSSRVPSGCWLTSLLEISPVSSTVIETRFFALSPRFNEANRVDGDPSVEVIIQSQKILAAISENHCLKEDYGLSARARIALASDNAFLSVIEKT